MDDPWGSPWTSNNDDFGSFASAPSGTGSGAVSPGPKPPRPALLAKISNQDLASDSSNSKPPTLSFSSLEPSPWADDDNFGDWAAADSGSLGWGSALPSFSDDSRLSPRPKDRLPQPSPQFSPVQWATSMTPIARPPGALTPRSRASSTMSRASDPWGQREKADVVDVDVVDFVDKDKANKVDTLIAETEEETGNAAMEDTGYDTEEAESRTESHVDTDLDHRDDHHETEDGHNSQQQVSPTTSVEDEEDDSEEDSEGSEDNEDSEENEDNADTKNDLQLENSQDKSEGPNYPALRRKPSSKVQGLVELFDGLAKRPISASGSLSGSLSGSKSGSRSASATRSVSATRSMERRPSRQLSTKDLPEDGVDEEEDQEEEGTIEPVPETAEEAVETLPEPKESSQAEAQQITVEPIEVVIEKPSEAQPDISSKEVAPAQPETKEVKDANSTNNASTITPADALLALYGKQEPYVVDTVKVDALFPILPKPRTEEDEKNDVNAFIPDGYILDDSFTNISERRTWYRIARHGSSRKHDAGGSEDDNYRPVTWATSTVLPETVKIVRRWMEEDSFTGKPTLGAGLYSGGGGGRGTNMFGWDSAAEPVTLEQVFKRAASPASSASFAKKEDTPQQPRHAHSRTLSNTNSAAAAAASAFGWGSDASLPPVSQASKEAKETARHSVHFGGFPSLASFGSEGGDNIWAAPEAVDQSKSADKPVSPIRPSFDAQTRNHNQTQNQPQNGDYSRRGHRSTPSIGSLPPPPKVVARPSPLSINTVVSKSSAEAVDSDDSDDDDDNDNDSDDDDDDEWGEMVMSPTAGETFLPLPVPLMPATASIPILAPSTPAAPVASFSAPAAAPPKAVSFQEPFSEIPVPTDNTSFIDSIIGSLPDLSYMAV